MASIRRSIVVSLLFIVLGGPGFLLVYIPYWITHFHIPAQPLWQLLPAAVLILAGLAPLLDSIWRFVFAGRGTLVPAVPTERLVVTGLYRFVRNPMYVGVLSVVVGEAILFRSRAMWEEAAIAAVAMHLFVLLYEEPTMTRRHPEDYPRYRRHVPRWLPRLTPWNDAGGDHRP